MESKSITQTKEAVELVLAAAQVVKSARADGKVDMADIGLLLLLVPKVGPAVDGVAEIPSELADLSPEEAAELSALIASKLVIESPKVADILVASLKAVAAVVALVKALNAPVAVEAPSA